MLMRTQESSENRSPLGIVHRRKAEPIVIDGRDNILSVTLLAEGRHVVSGGRERKIRRWRIQDGMEVGRPMDAGSPVLNIAVSQDGKWIVSGTESGFVTVWNAESHSKVAELKAHLDFVRAVDISPDATKIATGSDDNSACVWSLSTGKRQLGPLRHSNWVVAAKFSPDGRLIVTATWNRDSVRVYDGQNGNLLFESPVKVNSVFNHSLAWASDSKQFFALSHDGCIYRVDMSTGTILSKWRTHSTKNPTCISLASNGTFLAASGDSSVSLWDTTTQEQIGSAIEYPHNVWSMAMSSNYDLVTSGDKRIILRALCGTLPPHYLNNVSVLALEKNWRS